MTRAKAYLHMSWTVQRCIFILLGLTRDSSGIVGGKPCRFLELLLKKVVSFPL